MRWRALAFTATVGFVLLVSAAPALAKGADQATISGPGLAQPIVVGGNGEPGSSDQLGALSDGSGLFLAMFAPVEEPLAGEAPAGPLGPKYQLSYRVPDGTAAGATVRQDLYPQAAGGPVTYTEAGQAVFGDATRGGWYRGPATFATLLAALGVPTGPVATSQASPRQIGGAAGAPASAPTNGWPWLPIVIAVVVVAVVAAAVTLGWRRAVARRP